MYGAKMEGSFSDRYDHKMRLRAPCLLTKGPPVNRLRASKMPKVLLVTLATLGARGARDRDLWGSTLPRDLEGDLDRLGMIQRVSLRK